MTAAFFRDLEQLGIRPVDAYPRATQHVPAMIELIDHGWGGNNPVFRQLFTSRFIPGGTEEQIAWFNELCRKTTSPRNAVKLLDARAQVDVRAVLPEVRVPTLVLLRHGQSQWNLEDRFTGWVDVDLTAQGEAEAKKGGELIKAAGLAIDRVFTSVLTRAIRTSWLALAAAGQTFVPEVKDWRLNERHYGGLTGLNKTETAARHGADQVKIWRRSYDIPPPALDENDPAHPSNDRRYSHIPDEQVPVTESLKDTVARFIPYWESAIAPDIKAGKHVLIAAHGNSLRALVKYLDNVSDHDIVENSHASTSLSYADGLARAYALQGDDRHVVAVIGDGALTGGMAWEALNNIAAAKNRPLVIVVNDNERSYAPTIGGLANHLATLRTTDGFFAIGDGSVRSSCYTNNSSVTVSPTAAFGRWTAQPGWYTFFSSLCSVRCSAGVRRPATSASSCEAVFSASRTSFWPAGVRCSPMARPSRAVVLKPGSTGLERLAAAF